MRASPSQPPPEPLLQQSHPRTGPAFGCILGSELATQWSLHSVLEKGVSGTEYPFRTTEDCFEHRGLHENASRTVGSLFEHRMRIPYRRRPSPVPNATGCPQKATQCPRNLRSLLQVEAADPSGVG